MSLVGVHQGQGLYIQPHPATGHLGRVDITFFSTLTMTITKTRLRVSALRTAVNVSVNVIVVMDVQVPCQRAQNHTRMSYAANAKGALVATKRTLVLPRSSNLLLIADTRIRK